MEKEEDKKKKRRRMVFVAHDSGSIYGPCAYSGVFPDDFSLELDPETCTITGLVHKFLTLEGGASEGFPCLIDRSGKRVDICRELEAKSIAELELKIDLYNLDWEQ